MCGFRCRGARHALERCALAIAQVFCFTNKEQSAVSAGARPQRQPSPGWVAFVRCLREQQSSVWTRRPWRLCGLRSLGGPLIAPVESFTERDKQVAERSETDPNNDRPPPTGARRRQPVRRTRSSQCGTLSEQINGSLRASKNRPGETARGLLVDEDLSVGHVLHRSRRTAGGARSQCESARVLPCGGAPARGRGSGAARALATPHQRVDRCLRAGAVGKGPKEVESLAWRQLKPTVLAWETQTGDPARPIDVEAHTVSADSSQLTPQSLAHLGGASHRPTWWHKTLWMLAVTCGH